MKADSNIGVDLNHGSLLQKADENRWGTDRTFAHTEENGSLKRSTELGNRSCLLLCNLPMGSWWNDS